MDKQAVHDELERARASFHQLLETATPAQLAQASDGTRWTNRQLLFHMLFGYLLIPTLLIVTRLLNRLPPSVSTAFARALNAATRPFDIVNYLGSCLGARLLTTTTMATQCDRIIATLHRRLDTNTDEALRRGMPYPTRWDPFFTDYMTIADLYHYPTQHFTFHQHQLTLTNPHRPT